MLLVQAFQLSWPAFAHSIRDDDEARRTYAWVLTLYAGGMSWAVVVLGLAAPWLVRLLTAPAFYEAPTRRSSRSRPAPPATARTSWSGSAPRG